MEVKLSTFAEEDLAGGYAFYESQQEGLGDYFLDSLFADIDSLAIYAGIHRVIFGSHRLLAKTFPYAIYYEIGGEEARILAVVDCRRDPNKTKARIKRGRTRR